MEYERHGYVAREYYYGQDGELIAEIEDSYFLRDLEGYRLNADYVVFLGAVLYEASGSREQLISYENDNYALQSAGFEAGNIASIVIDGQEYSKHGRGINMVVYNTVTREVVYSGVHDTYQYQMQVP